jgi:hypothetical protein
LNRVQTPFKSKEIRVKLLHLLKTDEKSAVDAAWRKYVSLLESDGEDPKAVAEMKAVMHTLEKTAADAEADLKSLQHARGLLPVIAAGQGLDTQRDASHKAWVEYAAETERLIVTRTEDLRRLQDAEGELSRRFMASDRSAKELASLKHDHPELLAHIQPQTAE